MRALEAVPRLAALRIRMHAMLYVVLRPVRHPLFVQSHSALAVRAPDIRRRHFPKQIGQPNSLPAPFLLSRELILVESAPLALGHHVVWHVRPPVLRRFIGCPSSDNFDK